MSSFFINGTTYAISTSLVAAAVMTALSNAAPPVALAAAPPADGSIVVLKSGWTEINETVARTIGQVAATSFNLEGVDTTSLTRFPAGEGAGTFQVATDFVGLSQVRDVQLEGGEQNYFTFQYVEDQGGRQRRKPTFKSATGLNIVLDFDSSLPWYDALVELDRLREPVVLRETLPNGDVVYYYGDISFNKVPTKSINENSTVTATFSLLCDPIRYDAA